MGDRTALSLGDLLEVEAALDTAFAPLRGARTHLSPRRVRAAVRWGRGAEPPKPYALRWSGTIRRLSELSVAVGMAAMIFVGALGPATPDAGRTDASASLNPVATYAVSLAEEKEQRALLAARERAVLQRYVPLQDWLDPNVVRPAPVRLNLPAPPAGATLTHGPY
jgi:hypothetical protein